MLKNNRATVLLLGGLFLTSFNIKVAAMYDQIDWPQNPGAPDSISKYKKPPYENIDAIAWHALITTVNALGAYYTCAAASPMAHVFNTAIESCSTQKMIYTKKRLFNVKITGIISLLA